MLLLLNKMSVPIDLSNGAHYGTYLSKVLARTVIWIGQRSIWRNRDPPCKKPARGRLGEVMITSVGGGARGTQPGLGADELRQELGMFIGRVLGAVGDGEEPDPDER